MSMLEIKNLSTEFTTDNGIVRAVRDVSLHLEKGEVLAQEKVKRCFLRWAC